MQTALQRKDYAGLERLCVASERYCEAGHKALGAASQKLLPLQFYFSGAE
jgi:hypothetical protein